MTRITYRKLKPAWKYQLRWTYEIRVPIIPEGTPETDFLRLDDQGLLSIREGYAWDGPSGPMIDDETNMRSSLVHDALYQLMRLGLLPLEPTREAADRLFHDLCIEDGMDEELAGRAYVVLRDHGEPYAMPQPGDSVEWVTVPG